MNFSDRIRPNCEAAAWVCEEIKQLERDNAELRAALTLGQENCNEEYARLRKERDANKTALAATRSQIVALREDKARLDWLDEKGCWLTITGQKNFVSGSARAVIDAAMQEAKQ